MFWGALSSVATIAAVVTAFAIVKYDHKLNNRKKIKIEWRDALVVRGDGVPIITIKFINIGNRKIIIDSFCIVLSPSRREFQTLEWIEKLPYPLEIEEATTFIVPALEFARGIQKEINEENLTPNEEIILKMTDTTGREYIHKTGKKFSDYLPMLKIYSDTGITE
jgi:hypothetical protein